MLPLLFDNFLLATIRLIKLLESRISRQKGGRSIAFDQPPVLHNCDPVEVHDSIQAMRDSYDCAVDEYRANHLLH